MDSMRKVTVELPGELLRKAQRTTGAGITATIRTTTSATSPRFAT